MTGTPVHDVAALADRFPPGFTFGVASSAYQIEGAVAAEGRGPSIWDTFSHEPGRIQNGDTGDLTCDHYHRWAEDLDLLAALGVGAYRFSVSWPRVLPAGTGATNERGIDFYDRLIDGLLERGIEPFLTAYHWDLPQALQDRGGWVHQSIVEAFADYVGLLADRFGDRVRTWITINEPQVFAFFGHAIGRHAPGERDWGLALRVAGAALAAHAVAAARIRARAPDARVGVALDLNLVEPATTSEEDVQAALLHRAIRQDWFLDPLFGLGYPERALAAHREAGHLPDLDPPELPGSGLDFLGVNYYTREIVEADPGSPFGIRVTTGSAGRQTTMGWEVHPDGLRQVLIRLHRDYGPPSMVVTENGAAFADPEPGEGVAVPDFERREYLAAHLEAAARALAEGVPLSGYFAWSLFDNFEWEKGFGQRFGLVRVDYATQQRSLKESGEWYRSLVQQHRAGE
ncbi:MAG: GH1 family beta-glucosidase [Chloroflexota bacterium]